MPRQWWILACLVIASVLPLRAQSSEEWLPITSADRQFKQVPQDPGAAAVELYYADFRDDNRQHQFIYHRIKVLAESGRKYANVQIAVPLQYTVTGIQARTVHPDGKIAEFTGKPYERILSTWRDERFIARTFTFPEVTVGSILEYKYQLSWEKNLPDAVWTVQHSLYTVKERFSLRPYRGPLRTRHVADQTQLSYVFSNLPAGVSPKDKGDAVEMTAENVPAFEAEPYMPPEGDFKAEVRFFYGGREIESPEVFWADLGRQWYAAAEHFIGSRPEIKAAAEQTIGAESDAESRLKKLYARVLEIRNLSFERARIRIEDKKEDLKSNESVTDVLTRGYGYRNEIAELFAALARAAGFDAELLRASSRRDHVFNSRLLSEEQLNVEIVRVNINGAPLYLDPGTRFCPFGMVAWDYTSTAALKLDKNGGEFVVVPTTAADKNVVRRTADLALNHDGSAQGDLIVEFKGNDALEHRLSALNTDEAGRQQMLEEEIAGELPVGSFVHLEDVAGWNSGEEPLVAHFSIAAPRFAQQAAKRWLVPATLFQSSLPGSNSFGAKPFGEKAGVFSSTTRKYPFYFPYTYEQVDRVSLQLPPEYSVQLLPDGQDVKLPSTRFLTTRSASAAGLEETRALVVNSIYFKPEDYGSLKHFFERLKSADEEQVVISAKQAASGN